ncbi:MULTISPECIES: M50 family metallopeptidase [unclassified Sphingobium]|uniref:M50 family metallopeptidase n=1 Tax=unclassified Sphingobium TaxID=2611147 RepID=UPI00222542C8|nr:MULTISPECIES: RIP metalloprotease [unclassified Sphingobium]MCW2381594.1 regulator of sigma E protease [Sphingobium sp. B2D3B]MCW2398299.1 regulator of sigma E protease [Sphingobium sp. B2D3C]
MTDNPGFFFTILAFLLVIGPLVFVHELGHYLVGRWFGVHAETFSIGFGKEVFAWHDKRGTRWRVAALPLGGYVKFAGDMNAASQSDPSWLQLPPDERNRTFQSKSVGKRALIVLAGPLINLLFAAIILGGFAYAYGENVTPADVTAVEANSAADRAGILPGDKIRGVDGKPVELFGELRQIIVTKLPGEEVTLTVQRGGAARQIPVKIGEVVQVDRFGNEFRYGALGVRSLESVSRTVGLLEAPWVGVRRTGELIGMMASGLADIVTGRRSVDELGGPLKIAQISGEQAALGPEALIAFVALVSINLGFINLLPIPMLDGGHLFFYGIEAIQRRPVSPRFQEMAFRSGLALLLGLMIFVTLNDLASFGVWRGLSGLIG